MEQQKKGALGAFAEKVQAPPPSAQAAPRARDRRGPSDGRKQFLVYLQPEGIQALKMIALERETTASEVVAEAVNEWLQRQGRPPVA